MVQIMPWYETGDKLLSEIMTAQINNAYDTCMPYITQPRQLYDDLRYWQVVLATIACGVCLMNDMVRMSPSQYLNQYGLIIKYVLQHLLQDILKITACELN